MRKIVCGTEVDPQLPIWIAFVSAHLVYTIVMHPSGKIRAPLAVSLLSVVVAVLWSSQAQSFRNCDPAQDSESYRGRSSYFIGELEFDEQSGETLGTETHFNYSNNGSTGVVECHVTYELTGVYESGSGLFLLEARRSGNSIGCDSEFLDTNYPPFSSYTLQVESGAGSRVKVTRADSGEALGEGTLGGNTLSYKTAEVCELY